MFKSAFPEIKWPAFPSPTQAIFMALAYQLEKSERLVPEKLLEYQLQQLDALLSHAYETIPFYRKRLEQLGIKPHEDPITLDKWQNIPTITRDDIQVNGEELICQSLPKHHGQVFPSRTSGSTGKPLTTYNSNISSVFYQAIMLRYHLWYQRDFNSKLAVIKYFKDNTAPYPDGKKVPTWETAPASIYKTGSMVMLNIHTNIDQQLEWLSRENPQYLVTYPSNAVALAQLSLSQNIKLSNLRQVMMLSEVVDEKVRSICQQAWGVDVSDVYSSNEAGCLAIECPEHKSYHIQSEVVYLEVLNEKGESCQPGEIGRVVVTPLHNFAMPLIRYELGDYAEVGEACLCGRGLPVLKRILGRTRNLLTFPSGERFWPVVPHVSLQKIAPIKQRQFVQKTKEQIEARLVVARNLTEEEEDSLTKHIQKKLGYPFQIIFVYQDKLSRSEGGKFEEFISEV